MMTIKGGGSYLKFGNGKLWSGQSKVMLWFSRISIVRLLSPVVIFGATLPTGSINFGMIHLLNENF